MKKFLCGPITLYRKYVYQIGISILCLLFLSILSLLICQKAVENYAQIQRFRASALNEIVFSASPDFDESFYNLNGNAYAFTGNGKRLNCDILMTCDDRQYAENPLYLKGELPAGTCAISENLAFACHLAVGDPVELRVGGEPKIFTFTIDRILPAQSGIDDKYMHNGILILAETEGATEGGKYIYTSFVQNEDEYKNLVDDPARGKSVVMTTDIIRKSHGKLILYAVEAVLALCAFMAICEIIIFAKIGKKYRDYRILNAYGIGRRHLLGTIFRDMAIKYLLPMTVHFGIWYGRLQYHHASYVRPALVFWLTGLVIVTYITCITAGRRKSCHRRKRLSLRFGSLI